MKRVLFTSGRLLTATILALLLTSQLPAGWVANLTRTPRDLVTYTLVPFQAPIKQVADAFRAPEDIVVELGPAEQIERNYLDLLAVNSQLRQQVLSMQQTIDQLTALRQRLSENVELVPARVSAELPTGDMQVLAINRGQRHGVELGMTVATGSSLVGRISQVGVHTASVKLISTPGTRLVAAVVSPLPQGDPRRTLTQVEATEAGDHFTGRADVSNPVQVGDLAHLADDRWPRAAQGLIIGMVVDVQPDPSTPLLRSQFTVRPLRSLRHLGQVVVVRVTTEVSETLPSPEP